MPADCFAFFFFASYHEIQTATTRIQTDFLHFSQSIPLLPYFLFLFLFLTFFRILYLHYCTGTISHFTKEGFIFYGKQL